MNNHDKNLELLREANSRSSANFQDFQMPENNLHHPLVAPGIHLLPAEVRPYHHPVVDSYQNLGVLNNGTALSDNLYRDFSLESEFSRLNVSGGGSSVMRNPGSSLDHGVSFPYLQTPQFSNADLQRMRLQSATRGQVESAYSRLIRSGNQENSSAFAAATGSLGGICHNYNGLGSVYGGGAARDQPRAHRNGFYMPNFDRMGYEHHLNLTRNKFREIDVDLPYRAATSTNGVDHQPNYSVCSMNNGNGSLCRPKQRLNFQSLEELRGRIPLAAKDQQGCRFLQNKFEEEKPEEINMIFSELKDHIRELMVDQFANYLVQKLFEVCNEEQINQLLLLVINDERSLMNICLDMHGTRSIQKLLEHLTTPKQKSLVISILSSITVTLTNSINGHHVIQHCLKLFSGEDVKQIITEIAENCLHIATDKSGCCVLQHCVAHAKGESRNRLLQEIASNALVLSENPYGNYVVQYILALKLPHVTTNILDQLAGKFVTLSMNKYGSNVVEKCLRESQECHAYQIINEIINSPNFLMVLQDPYGNYVAQSALSIAKGHVRHTMVNLILVHYAFLHSHPHGKRVLARTRGSKHRV